ncbi:MAG: WXG100 family type VII secretion target [Actinomycetota bacterium]|nr:WXG100 family type VII secretion target [Actinomycetota bacterium]
MTTQQQRAGAQRAAAGRVRDREAQFQSDLRTLMGEAEALRRDYQGPAAAAFFALIGQWLDDAQAIVRDMEGFAGKLDRQESEVAAQQDQSATTFSRAATRLTTTA